MQDGRIKDLGAEHRMEHSGCRCETQDLGCRYRVPDEEHRRGTVEAFRMRHAEFRMQTQDLRKNPAILEADRECRM